MDRRSGLGRSLPRRLCENSRYLVVSLRRETGQCDEREGRDWNNLIARRNLDPDLDSEAAYDFQQTGSKPSPGGIVGDKDVLPQKVEPQ
jgi:hypothetical protein